MKFSKQGLDLLSSKYFLTSEKSPIDLFTRIAKAYQEDEAHGTRMLDYFSKQWITPSTPILANAGSDRGLPISCFLLEIGDNVRSICNSFSQAAWLSINGGGLAINVSNIRSIGEKISSGGITSGIQPFNHIYNSLAAGIAQGGSLRRGSTALYLDVSHPEILNFLQMRKSTGGDIRSKNLDSHHGIMITDAFMEAVLNKKPWPLRSPKTNEIIKEIDAFELFCTILEVRSETGEPYIFFYNNVQEGRVSTYKKAHRGVTMSNLCTEILLHTNEHETAVCCLASFNLEVFDEWKDNKNFYYDSLLFMKNVLNSFIFKAEQINESTNFAYNNALNTCKYERSIGLGVMGYHYYLQKNNIPFESDLANEKNEYIFKTIQTYLDQCNEILARQFSPAPLCKEYNEYKYFTNLTAIAPTASISIITNQTSLGIEPVNNLYDSKTNGTRDIIKNRYLEKLIKDKNLDEEKIWTKIIANKGSIQDLNEFTDEEKSIYKTPFEIDQFKIIDQASTRQKYIDQGQSLNLFVRSDIPKQELYNIHKYAWIKKIKTLYYLRSQATSEKESLWQDLCESCQ